MNSVRVYKLWDYDWCIPLGNLEMREFGMHVPLEFRIDKRLCIADIKWLAAHMVGNDDKQLEGTERDTVLNRIKKS